MKIVGLIASVIVSFVSFSQNSYYFSHPLLQNESSSIKIDSKFYGEYSSLDQPRHYEVSELGIHLVSTNISTISRTTIRESSKYKVRNGFILGVLKNDSVPCVLDGENYYFGIQNKELIVGIGSKNILTKIDDFGNYLVNTYEDGMYIPMKISFKSNEISVSYFDYESDTKSFKFINEQTSSKNKSFNIVVLSPTEKEIKRLLKNSLFGDNKTFNKI